MARVTIEDCLDNQENRFALVMLATKRARQLCDPNNQPLVESKNKEAVTALREIAHGRVKFDRDVRPLIERKSR